MAPLRLRMFVAIFVVVLSAGGTLGGLVLYAQWRLFQGLQDELARARGQLDLQLRARLELERELGAQIEHLTEELERRKMALSGEASRRAALERALAEAETQLAALRQRHEAALADLRAVAEGAASAESRLAALAAERQRLGERVAALEERVAQTLEERDAARRNERGLRWRMERLEQRLAEADASRQVADRWLREWITRQVQAVETMLSDAGVDPGQFFERASEEIATGQGGPFEPASEDIATVADRPVGFGLDETLLRLWAAQQLIARLPLGAPLDEFRLTSGYGSRMDPITGERAIHRGIDFAAPRDSRVLAPAPGRVLRAERDGAYGLLVEIDHGMGIVTLYGHLKKLLVSAGDRVDFRQPIGIVGSTGRSTGRHLHYEIRIDGKPIDPGGFIEAARKLIDVLKG